ncbi:MAG: hypothetical protein AAGK37_04910 [Pseudomonadota bacterium]
MTPTVHAAPRVFAELSETGGVIHATAVEVEGRALVICGPSGSGKSELALALMALGAELIADDRTELRPRPGSAPLALAPHGLPAAIEARGLGLLNAGLAPSAPITAILDLATTETARLPSLRVCRVLGHDVVLLHKTGTAHFPSALMQYLAQGFARL